MSADLSGIGNYVGTVEGILQAVADPRFEGDFVENMLDTVETHFMTDTIALRAKPNLKHVFDWGDNQGEVSSEPLFSLTRSGVNGTQTLGYTFLPSNNLVPLPDASRYGFSTARLTHLSRHTFQMKAIVMETMSKVTIAPKDADNLFIPTTKSPRGYVLTPKSVKVNPGGRQATGGFATHWNQWFNLRAQSLVNDEVASTEKWLVATGAKYVRYAAGTKVNGQSVGGRFASGKNVSIGYVNAKAKEVKRKVKADSKRQFDAVAWRNQRGDA